MLPIKITHSIKIFLIATCIFNNYNYKSRYNAFLHILIHIFTKDYLILLYYNLMFRIVSTVVYGIIYLQILNGSCNTNDLIGFIKTAMNE